MYEYISDDDSSYTLKGKDGKEFKVAKKYISDSIHKKITGMKPVKMADGGLVDFVKTRSEPIKPGDESNYPNSFANNFASNLPEAVAPYFKRSLADEKKFHQNFGENAGMAGMGTVENVGNLVKGPWKQEVNAIQEQAPSMIEKFMARFGDDKKIINAIKKAQGNSTNPYVDISHVDKAIGWAPNFHGKSVTEIGQPGIAESYLSKNLDPFMWADSKYGATKEMLNNAKGPVKIHTSSDLIGRDDYLNMLPQGSEINMYLMPKNESLAKSIFPGNPSRLRQEAAIERLRQNGIKVNAIEPTPDSILMAVKNKIPKSGLEFGNQKNDPFENLSEVLGVGPFGIEGKRKLYQMMNGKGEIGPVPNFAKGGIVPDALDPNYQPDVGQLVTPDLSAPIQSIPQQTTEPTFKSPSSALSDEQWNQLSPQDRAMYMGDLSVKGQSPLSKLGSYVGDIAAQNRAQKNQELAQYGAAPSVQQQPIAQAETPEQMLQKQLSQPAQPQAQTLPVDAYGLSAKTAPLGFMGDLSGPITRNAKVQEEMYKQQADIYGQMAKQEEYFKQQADIQAKAKQDVVDRMDKLYNDVRDAKIDPYKVWNDSSTGQKAGLIVGMLLSGIGQGLQGPGARNMAMDVYDKMIDRSIEAQRLELGKKQNLLSENIKLYGDLGTAETATRAAYLTALGAKINQASAQAQSAQARDTGKLALAELNIKMAPLMIQMQQARANAMSLGYGGGQGGIPVNAEPYSLLSDKDYQKHRVVVGGRAYQAVDDESAKKLRDLQSEYEPVKQMVSELNSLVANPKALTPGTAENAKARSLQAYLVPRINAMHGLTRLSEEDIKTMANQLSDPASFRGYLEGNVRNETFLRNLNDDLNENYKTRLVNFGGMPGMGFKPAGKVRGQ